MDPRLGQMVKRKLKSARNSSEKRPSVLETTDTELSTSTHFVSAKTRALSRSSAMHQSQAAGSCLFYMSRWKRNLSTAWSWGMARPGSSALSFINPNIAISLTVRRSYIQSLPVGEAVLCGELVVDGKAESRDPELSISVVQKANRRLASLLRVRVNMVANSVQRRL